MGSAPSRLSKCTVCCHPERARIEMLRAGGASFEGLAGRFELHRDAIWRHWSRHVDDSTKAQYIAGPIQLTELAERAAAEGLSLLDYLGIMRSTLLMQFSATAASGDARATARVSGRLLDVLREIGKFTGEIAAAGVNFTSNTIIMQSPQVAAMQAAIIGALAPYPEARTAVVQALRQLDAEMGDDAGDEEDEGLAAIPGAITARTIDGEAVHGPR